MSLNQSICQYGIILWEGITENILKPLIYSRIKRFVTASTKINKAESSKENYKNLVYYPCVICTNNLLFI